MKRFFKVGCLSVIGLSILTIVIAIFAPSPEDEPEVSTPEIVSEPPKPKIRPKEVSTPKRVSQQPKIRGRISAAELVEEYNSNEIAADMRYKGKVWRITGSVRSTEQSFGSLYVILEGDGFLNNVHCTLKDSEKSKAAMLSKGDDLAIQGKIDGEILGSVSVSKCVIIQ